MNYNNIFLLQNMINTCCWVHKPGVPHRPAFQQRLSPADNVANDAQTLGTAQKPKQKTRRTIQSPTRRPGRGGTTPASDSGPPLRPKGLAKEEQRSLLTPAHLRTASPTGGPGQTPLSDSDPRLQPGTRRTPAYSSSSTGAIRASWDQPIGDARSVRTREQMKKVKQDT